MLEWRPAGVPARVPGPMNQKKENATMYEKNQPPAWRRSGDEFLRGMSRGALPGKSLPTMNVPAPAPEAAPPADTACGCAGMPSLAMVYSPVQEWRNLLPPQQALQNGSLFGELVKPFMGRSICRGTR